MTVLGSSVDVRRLHEVHSILAEARTYAHRFNEDYVRLVAEVRTAVDSAGRAGSPRRALRR